MKKKELKREIKRLNIRLAQEEEIAKYYEGRTNENNLLYLEEKAAKKRIEKDVEKLQRLAKNDITEKETLLAELSEIQIAISNGNTKAYYLEILANIQMRLLSFSNLGEYSEEESQDFEAFFCAVLEAIKNGKLVDRC